MPASGSMPPGHSGLSGSFPDDPQPARGKENLRNLAAKIKHYLDGLPTGGQPVPANEAADETSNFALPSATAHQFPTSHEMGMPMGPVGGISPPFYIQPDDNWVNNGVDESAMQGIEYHGTGAAVEGHFGGYGSDMHCGSNVWDADGPDNVAMLSSSCTSSGSVRSEHSVTTISSQRSEPRDGAVLEKMQAILELVNRLQEKHSSIDVGVMLPLGRKDPIQEAAGSYQQIIDLLQADVDDYTKEAPLIADEDEICPQPLIDIYEKLMRIDFRAKDKDIITDYSDQLEYIRADLSAWMTRYDVADPEVDTPARPAVSSAPPVGPSTSVGLPGPFL